MISSNFKMVSHKDGNVVDSESSRNPKIEGSNLLAFSVNEKAFHLYSIIK